MMDIEDAHKLIRATRAFYKKNAQSFSDTRANPWVGWNRILKHLPKSNCPLRVVDIGCGNLRFEAFLERELPSSKFEVLAVDFERMNPSCDIERGNLRFLDRDICESLEEGTEIGFESFGADICAAFGIMHHIPVHEWRISLLRRMADSLSEDGFAVATFWHPLGDTRILKRAIQATLSGSSYLDVQLDMDAGDTLLGWKSEECSWRYCHDFTETEVMELASKAEVEVVGTFLADGAQGDSNCYLLFKGSSATSVK